MAVTIECSKCKDELLLFEDLGRCSKCGALTCPECEENCLCEDCEEEFDE